MAIYRVVSIIGRNVMAEFSSLSIAKKAAKDHSVGYDRPPKWQGPNVYQNGDITHESRNCDYFILVKEG